MNEYAIHGLLAIPLTFTSLKCLSYLSAQPITRGQAILWCSAAFLLGSLGLGIAIPITGFLGICAAVKLLDKLGDGNWLNKHI